MNRKAHRARMASVLLASAFSLSTAGAADLVAHYEFENPEDLGHDSSGMENHATTVANVTHVEGQIGQGGASFDEGQGSVFRIDGGLTGFTGTPGRSYSAWVKLDPATTGFDGVVSQDTGGCCGTRILTHPDHKPFINLTEHIDRHLTGSPAIVVDEWTHIAMTGSDEDGGSVARVYLGGVEVGAETFANTMLDSSTWNTYLGVGESGTAHRLTGDLDDVRIYEGALTEQEIQELLDPPTTGFQIIEVVYDGSVPSVDLTFTSRPGRTYAIETSTTLSGDGPGAWVELDDGVASQGEVTTYTDMVAATGARVFYRVREV